VAHAGDLENGQKRLLDGEAESGWSKQAIMIERRPDLGQAPTAWFHPL
jgi:hypothetical protein